MIDKDTGEVITPFLRTEHNYDMNAASLQSALACKDPSRTQQQFKDECDINVLVERFGIDQLATPLMDYPTEQDFTNVMDFQSSLNVMRRAQESFDSLPAKIRNRFDNDTHKFMQFVHDPENMEESVRLGIRNPPPPQEKVDNEPPGDTK